MSVSSRFPCLLQAALKAAGLDFTVTAPVDPIKVLDVLQAAFGQRGYYTCDTG